MGELLALFVNKGCHPDELVISKGPLNRSFRDNINAKISFGPLHPRPLNPLRLRDSA